ncbi:MAG TPA: DUF6143 family protein [Bacillota bacterium]|nr:DUF6143 family protein [Bacillota bacterium]
MLSLFRKNKPTQKVPLEVVDITSPTQQSILGKYFIGQTQELTLEGTSHAWGGLVNPSDSKVNLFFDIFTVTNFSRYSFLAEIWLNAKLPGNPTISTYVHPSNLTLHPLPKPKVSLQFVSQTLGSPSGGVNAFDRIVVPNTTLISDSSKGSIIIPPGGSFAIFLLPLGSGVAQSRIVLTWWEEQV